MELYNYLKQKLGNLESRQFIHHAHGPSVQNPAPHGIQAYGKEVASEEKQIITDIIQKGFLKLEY